MPAYNFDRGYALVFILFTIVALFIFLSIVLASVYDSYRRGLEVGPKLCHTVLLLTATPDGDS